MNYDNGRLNFSSGLDNSKLQIDADETRSILRGISDSAQSEGAKMEDVFNKVGMAIAGAFTVNAAIGFAKACVGVRQEIESLEISFRTLLGNQQKADAMFSQIRTFAVQTPMQLKDLASAAKMMLSFNIEEDKIMPYLKALGDISMGDTQRFQSLSLAFSQMSATGKLMGQDLMQMINAGFNPLSIMAEKTGKSVGELKDEMSKGAITAAMVQQAFVDATSEGGKFNNMLLEQSKGIQGARSNLQGAIDDMMNDIGSMGQEAFTSMISMATEIVKNYKSVAEYIGVLIGMYGVYRTALLVNEAINKNVSANILRSYEAEIAASQALVTQKNIEAEATLVVETADVRAAVAKGSLTEAQALEVIATREAVAAKQGELATAVAVAEAKLASATAAQTEAQSALTSATAVRNAAVQKELAMTAIVERYRALMVAAKESGDVEQYNWASREMESAMALQEAAAIEANTAAEKLNTAQINANTAAKNVQNAQSAVNTATTAKETFVTSVDTMAKGSNTAATNLLSAAKVKLMAVCEKLWAVVANNPWGIALAAVVALAYGIYKLITYQTDYEKSLKKLDEATAEYNKSLAGEERKIDSLFAKLKAAKEGTEEYEKAKKNILTQYGDYLKGLNKEISTLKDVEGAYKAVTAAARESARERAIQNFTQTAADTLSQKEGDIRVKLRKLLEEKFAGKTDENGLSLVEKYYEQILNSQMFKPESTKKLNEEFVKQFDVLYMEGKSNVTKNALRDLSQQMGWALDDYGKIMQEAQIRFGEYTAKGDKGDEASPVLYQEGLTKAKKRLEDAKKTLEDLKRDGKATQAQVKSAMEEVAAAEKALKDDYGYDPKAGQRSANTIAVQTADRLKKIKDYAEAVAKAERQAQLDIAQSRIDAMQDGFDKTIAQNRLNYDKLIFQNQQRKAEMLEKLRDIKQLEWENANPKAKESGKTFDRSSVSDSVLDINVAFTANTDEFSQEQIEMIRKMRAQLTEYANIASSQMVDADRKALEAMVGEIATYQQQRQKIEEEYQRKRLALYENEVDEQGRIILDAQGNAVKRRDKDGNMVLRSGIGQGNVEEFDRKYEEALNAIDMLFAQREESFQSWSNEIANLSLDQLDKMLKEAESMLEEMTNDGDYADADLAKQRAKVVTLRNKVKKGKSDESLQPGKRTIKEWQDLYKTLMECEREFEDIGKAVGGTVGDIISSAGQIATSTLSMINAITTLANWSVYSTELTAKGVSKSIQMVEKASVILTIISAALQVATAIASLFNSDNKKQKEIDALQDRIDQLEWELDHAEIMRYTSVDKSIEQVKQAIADTRVELFMANKESLNYWERLEMAMSRPSKNAELMKGSVEKLTKAYANMSYTADKALGGDKYGEAKDKLENIAQQQILIQEQIDKERSKKKTDSDQITEWEQKIAELGQEAIEVINDMVEEIIGGSAADIAEELGDAFIEAFQEGEDAAKAWGDKVNEIVADILKRMLISEFLEKPLGQIFDDYKSKWFKDGEFLGIDAVMNSMTKLAEDLNGVGNDFEVIWSSIPDSIKSMLEAASEFQQDGSTGGFQAMSQDTGDELNGRFTALQINSEAIKECVLAMKTTVEELRNISLISMGYLESIEKSNKELYDINSKLDDIVRATKNI